VKNHQKIHDLSPALEEVRKYTAGESSDLQPMNYDDSVSVKEIREKLNMTQEEFSKSFGVSLATIQNWEQGRRSPEGPARVLLKLIMRQPNLVKEALTGFTQFREKSIS
jgi:putative transcriptional regulator